MKQSLALFAIIVTTILVSYVYAQQTDYDLQWSYETDGWVRSTAVSEDGKYVAAGSQDSYVYLFDKDGRELWRYKTRSFANSVSVSSKGPYVAAASDDTNVYLFDGNGTVLWAYDIGAKGVDLVSISKDGAYISAASDNNVYFLDRKGVALWSYKIGDDVYGISVSSDGSYVAVGSGDTNVYFFDRNGRILWTYDTGNIGVSSVSVSENGSFVVATSRLNNLYKINSKGVLNWSSQIEGNAMHVSILANGSTITVQSDDGNVYFFSTEGELLKSLRLGSSIKSLSISKEGLYIVASYERPSPMVYLYKENIPQAAEENITIVNLTTTKPIQKPKVVVVANSIDFDMAIDFLMFLKNKGIRVVHASASDFNALYKNEKFVVILGGPEAYEKVGGLVREVLPEDEQNAIRQSGSRNVYIKTDVWNAGQKVIVIAGSDRDQTKTTHQENRERVTSELGV
jgi:ribosomal protein S11